MKKNVNPFNVISTVYTLNDYKVSNFLFWSRECKIADSITDSNTNMSSNAAWSMKTLLKLNEFLTTPLLLRLTIITLETSLKIFAIGVLQTNQKRKDLIFVSYYAKVISY